jgi:hypothetical protein
MKAVEHRIVRRPLFTQANKKRKRRVLSILAKGLYIVLLVVGIVLPQWSMEDVALQQSRQSQSAATHYNSAPSSPPETPASVSTATKRADFKQEPVSQSTRDVANWIVDSGDNLGLPFLIIDKERARVFAFDADGQLNSAASVLVGLAVGDDSVPGIGKRKLSNILPKERTTPAGRFVAALGRDLDGQEILWVDYDDAIALHRVITSNPAEHRAKRLASPSIADKRISYGCINVPVDFFERVVIPIFRRTSGIVYVLPETRSTQSIFRSFYKVR